MTHDNPIWFLGEHITSIFAGLANRSSFAKYVDYRN